MNGNCHFIYGAAVGSALAINLDKISSVVSISNSSETATLLILGGLRASMNMQKREDYGMLL